MSYPSFTIYCATQSICLSPNLGIELLSRGFKVIFLDILGTLDKNWIYPYFSEEIPPFFIKDINSKNVYEKINFIYNTFYLRLVSKIMDQIYKI